MKKFLKQFALGLLAFIIVNAIIAVMYEYPTYKSVQNETNRNYLKWEAIHQNQNTFDLIFIGTSRSYTSFNPKIIDSALQTNSYNMSTSAQDIAETYFALEEIFEYQKPKYVVLDLFFQTADDSHDYFQTFSNSSFFNSTKRKFNLITEGYGTTGILNYSIPIVKFKAYIKQDIARLFSGNKQKRKSDVWTKGYLHEGLTVTDAEISDFEPISNFENTTFSKARFTKYFNKIKELVNANNAKLIGLRAPYPPSRFTLYETDDEGVYFKSYMAKENIPFYDLSTFKSDKYRYIDQDFADYHHPNYKGAKKASMQFIDIFKDIESKNN
ncbi:hypothetical protein [Winogradskyella sp. Asnod2-B02-A]|uniref:hypothetical protein n=1 Tax=Winogradskyella sp. Asnod2-B02-A TaxID=3160583 RepID=UPI003868AD6B